MALKKSYKTQKHPAVAKTHNVDDEMLSEIEEASECHEEQPEEEEEETPIQEEDGPESQAVIAKLVQYGKELGQKKLQARQSKADDSLQRCEKMFTAASEEMQKLETCGNGGKAQREKVVTFHVYLDKHLKAGQLNADAIKNDLRELEMSTQTLCSTIETFASRDLALHFKCLTRISSELDERSALLKTIKQKHRRLRKKTLSKLNQEDPLQTCAVVLVETLRSLRS